MSDYTSYVEDASGFDLSNSVHLSLAINDVIKSFEDESKMFGYIVAQAEHMINHSYLERIEYRMESYIESEVLQAENDHRNHLTWCAEFAVINARIVCGGIENVPDQMFCGGAVQLVRDAMHI